MEINAASVRASASQDLYNGLLTLPKSRLEDEIEDYLKMASTSSVEDHVLALCQEAERNLDSGNLEQATRQLQEASKIDENNTKIKEIWQKLEKRRDQSPLVNLCKKWVETVNDDVGEEALDYVHQHDITDSDAEQAMKTILTYDGDADMADQLAGSLIKRAGARKAVAAQVQKEPTETFRKLWDYGDDSMEGLTSTLFAVAAWPDDKTRTAALRDVFQLALAQLMDAGLDYPDRAMKAVSRLLAVEASKLNGIIDADSFDVILSNLDIRLPAGLRSQATLATSKLLELSPESAQQLIGNYVTAKVMKPTAESLLHAFSAAAAVFPMAPACAAQLFLSEGFLSAFVPMVKTRKSHRVELAALELLSAACIDKACREGVAKFCREWLQEIAQKATDAKRASLASLILIKIEDEVVRVGSPLRSKHPGPEQQEADLVNNFKNMVLTPDDTSKQDSLEGLAYASLKPKVKENLARDQRFLITLLSLLGQSRDGRPALFGGLTIFSNLTAYRPPLSEEQKKLSELKAYANTQKPIETDPLDDDEHVTFRCKMVLDAGIIPLLVTCSKNATPTIISLVLQILFALSKEQKHRGVMSQQGAVKLLLGLYDNISVQQASSTTKQSSLRLAGHALARILISVNPKHVFSSATALTTPIRPLVSLLTSPNQGFGPGAETPAPSPSPPLLATFESLLALTNLASTDANTADAIVRAAFAPTEDLLLSPNALVQRAAAELICNLCACPAGIAKFADGTGPAGNRLHILLALADADDVATRRAAGGALAMLTEWQEEVVPALLKRERAVEILLGLCEDEEGEDLKHRGLVCVYNIVSADGKVGQMAREKVKAENGKERIVEVMKGTRTTDLMSLGVQILKAIN